MADPDPKHLPPSIDLDALQQLAALELPAAEVPAMRDALAGVLADFAALQEVDTRGLQACRHPFDQQLPTRPDQPEPCPAVAAILALAPAKAQDCFALPRVLEP